MQKIKNTTIIGFGSKAQVGKDYAAIQLAKKYDVQRVAFADALKSDIAVLFKLSDLDLEAMLKDIDTKNKIRPLLVSYGQTMREFDPDIWVKRAFKDIRYGQHDLVVVTDVRFPNEAIYIQDLGGIYIDIDSDVPPANETEAAYAKQMRRLADFVIRNDFDENYTKELYALVEQYAHLG